MEIDKRLAALRETMANLGVQATLAVDATLAAPAGSGASAHHPSLPALAEGQGGAAVDFAVTRLLGEGGMGRVELARQGSLGREVAVKTVRPDRASAASIEQLVREARLTGALEHPNVIPVHALARGDDGRPVLVMKYVEGVAWRELILQPDHAAWQRARGDRLRHHLDILMQLCNAVEFAHSRGVVHRDLKPDNVMLGSFGEVYVVDWGLAAHLDAQGAASSSGPVGTPAYMAPEMLDGGPVTVRSDVYLLGAMLHEVLTGRPRHEGATVWDALRSALISQPVDYPAAVPAELGAIANRATSADPAARYASAHEFREAIADYLLHRGSIDLADQAARKLDELIALHARRGEAEATLELRKVAAECRFGFQQALRVWPGNGAARAGLQRCLEAMIEHELSERRDCGLLLEELPVPRPDLVARVDELRQRQREDEAARAELLRREHDQDFRVHASTRVRGVSLVGAAFAAAMLVAALATPRPSYRILLYAHGGLLGAMIAVYLKDRRLIALTRANRQVAATGFITIGGVVAFLLLGAHLALPPASALALWLACYGIGALTLGVGLDRRYTGAALLGFAGSIAAALFPAHALPIYVLVIFAGSALVMRAWSRNA